MNEYLVFPERGAPYTLPPEAQLKEFQGAVGGLIDVAPVDDRLAFYVNDEGLINGNFGPNLPLAFCAGVILAGPVVAISRYPDGHGNTLPISDHPLLERMLEMATAIGNVYAAFEEMKANSGVSIVELNLEDFDG